MSAILLLLGLLAAGHIEAKDRMYSLPRQFAHYVREKDATQDIRKNRFGREEDIEMGKTKSEGNNLLR